MPKDFTGKNKTAKTYDKDWVFVKTKQKGPNDSAGAWVTKRQRKDMIQDKRQLHDYRQDSAAPGVATAASVPGTATIPMPTAGTSPYLPEAYLPPTGDRASRDVPSPRPDTPGAPSWWINQAITNPATEEQSFANVANALLPSLSPEDQRTLANYLAQNNKDVFGGYATADFGAAPTEITDQIRQQYLSPQRAQSALSLLDRMKQASGVANMGAGYDYLKNAVNLINQFTTEGVMTRERYSQFTSAVANLNKNVGEGLSSYANLSQLFNLPQFSAGPLISNAPNARLFG